MKTATSRYRDSIYAHHENHPQSKTIEVIFDGHENGQRAQAIGRAIDSLSIDFPGVFPDSEHTAIYWSPVDRCAHLFIAIGNPSLGIPAGGDSINSDSTLYV